MHLFICLNHESGCHAKEFWDKGANKNRDEAFERKIKLKPITSEPIDLFSDPFHQHPYTYYKDIRKQTGFAKVMLPYGIPAWMAFHYDVAEAVLKDERFIKDARTVFPDEALDEQMLPISKSMLFVDPPDHKRLRGLIQKGFTPKRISRLKGRIDDIAMEQARQIKRKKRFDLIEEYAFPIPIIVICELLGVPDSDRDKFQYWSKLIVDLDNEGYGESNTVQKGMDDFIAYLQALINARRQEPREDLLSDLIRAEEDGDRLTTNELYGVVMLLIVAGHETTVNLIANGMLALLMHPNQLALLKNDYQLIPQAIEELLRYNSPVEFSTDRWARESFSFMGKDIKKGDFVIVSLASANHDEALVENPDKLDITREKSPHLSFGKGIHYCLGAPLARLEAESAIRILLEECPNIRLGVEPNDLAWRQSLVIRGLENLPVETG